MSGTHNWCPLNATLMYLSGRDATREAGFYSGFVCMYMQDPLTVSAHVHKPPPPPYGPTERHTDKSTDGRAVSRTDRQTDGQTGKPPTNQTDR